MSLILYSALNNGGNQFEVQEDASSLPADWDGRSLSLILGYNSVPCSVFSETGFRGLHLVLVHAGGCDDLDQLPGRWRNKIRSVRFGGFLLGENEAANIGQLMPGDDEEERQARQARHVIERLQNPSIAEAGCIWPDGRKTAYFRYAYPVPKVGSRISAVVFNPTYDQICQGGRIARMESLDLTVESTTVDQGSPFAQLAVTGR